MKKLKHLIITIISAITGAIGGQGIKFLRRFFIPLMLASLAYFKYQNLWVLLVLSLIGCYSLGYGEDSFLRKLFKGSNELTRGFISLLKCLSLLVLAILSGKWIIYIIGSISIILVGSFVSWRGLGTVKFFDKELLVVDLIIYGVDSLTGVLLL